MDILLISYCIGLVWLFVRSDKSHQRLTGLSSDGEVLPEWQILRAVTFNNRRIGLLNHSSLAATSALLLSKSRKVHTVGMLFAIDIVFLSRAGVVLGCNAHVAPGGRAIKGPRGTAMILEMAAGSVERSDHFSLGKTLAFPSLLTNSPAASSSP